ncbi:SNF2 family N-terminal domain-containing protein [Whalleya microplaca]|nr:SNF2 family N-terminal domain-containing protein [Whalleya microplaca]
MNSQSEVERAAKRRRLAEPEDSIGDSGDDILEFLNPDGILETGQDLRVGLHIDQPEDGCSVHNAFTTITDRDITRDVINETNTQYYTSTTLEPLSHSCISREALKEASFLEASNNSKSDDFLVDPREGSPLLESWLPQLDNSCIVDSQGSETTPMQCVNNLGSPSREQINYTGSSAQSSLSNCDIDCPPLESNLSLESPEVKNENMNSIVCFGMVTGITGRYERQRSSAPSSPFVIQLDSPGHFSSKEFTSIRGQIQSEHGQMIEGLLNETSLNLNVVCIFDGKFVAKKGCRGHILWPCTLELTVYGPFELFNDIGKWFQDYGIHLQDPRICHLNTKYCNPQRLSSEYLPSYPLVSEIISKTLLLTPKELQKRPDFLDILSSRIDLKETPQPLAIRTTLKSHQKQALTFMLSREEGWGFNHQQPDIWEIIDTGRGKVFMNTISHVCQSEEPPGFYGVIIADSMGLGKTLTMIALVATDLEATEPLTADMEDSETGKQDITATLVIIPPPLLDTWEEQLFEHVAEGTLRYRRHHGKNRAIGVEEFETVNIVLTTYHTVSAEWKQDTGKSPLFSVHWRRIILDEAHFIRNGNARMARAVCDFKPVSRWAVTGTPIQNRLGDLASLLQFIRVYPYSDPKQFDADISRPWKSGEDEEAVRRLKRLSACLLLRRAKEAINLPPRRDLIRTVDFTPEERTTYEQIKRQTITNIDEALGNNTGPSKPYVYVNALQQIESLRLFCNLGLHYHSRHEKQPQRSSDPDQWNNIAQRAFNSHREMASITCLLCSSTLGLTETLLDNSVQPTEKAQFTNCSKFVCIDCVVKMNRSGDTISCGHTPPCSTAPVSTSSVTLEEVENFITHQPRKAPLTLPSKIRALIDDIKGLPIGVKCIVFSTWRFTLDLIKGGLDEAGISSIRFDGKVPQKDRQTVVGTFRSDPNVRIMLLTLSCGAVGLNLTVASRAYLMEPHWNPTMEEQSLARIHRLGQIREVETVRFYVRDSFEEQVRKVQESKKQLAGVLLSTNNNEYTDNTLRALENLRSIL